VQGLPVLVIGGQGVGVYLRTSSRRNTDGSTVRYLSIAHNERSPGGPSVAKVLLPLGREDRLDVAGWSDRSTATSARTPAATPTPRSAPNRAAGW
jgi:hypothetical protein